MGLRAETDVLVSEKESSNARVYSMRWSRMHLIYSAPKIGGGRGGVRVE